MQNSTCKTYLFIFASIFFTFGCGKKAKENQANVIATQPIGIINTVQLAAQYTTDDETINTIYVFDKKVNVFIPKNLEVLKGNAGNQQAVLYFFRSTHERHFYCVYQGGANTISPVEPDQIKKGLSYNFVDCYNQDGVLNYIPGDKIYFEKNQTITLELLGADPRYNNKTLVDLEFEIF